MELADIYDPYMEQIIAMKHLCEATDNELKEWLEMGTKEDVQSAMLFFLNHDQKELYQRCVNFVSK